jgi:hypothetical protein
MIADIFINEAQHYPDAYTILDTVILAISLIVTSSLSFYIYLNNRKIVLENKISDQLFQIQSFSMQYPFLENKNFINGWLEFKTQFNLDVVDYGNENTNRYLQYEQYCEMLFNLVEDIYTANHKKESSLNDSINLKSWVRIHKDWWNNPLEDHSNHDSYDKSLCIIIDDWLK